MITESQAVMMIRDELPANELRHLQIKQLYESMQVFANSVIHLGENGELKRFETQLMVSDRMYVEGNSQVKEVMEKVYISSLSHTLERKPELLLMAKKILNAGLLNVMRHDQLANNP